MNGGNVNHSNYFDHVLRMPGFTPRITFSKAPEFRSESQVREYRKHWPAPDGPDMRWKPGNRDVLFLAGTDWRYLDECGLESSSNPRINFIQGIRHAYEGTELYGYLSRKALRICISPEIADAILATKRVNGPLTTIPTCIETKPVDPLREGSPAAREARFRSILIVGYKRPDLARALSRRLGEERVDHLLLDEFVDRSRFLELLTEYGIAVCLPLEEEGFYRPPLEAMAAGCVAVTLDAVGNRGFCLHEKNCLVAGQSVDSLFGATKRSLELSVLERRRLLGEAHDTATAHALDVERARFHAVLADVDRLWRLPFVLGMRRAAGEADTSHGEWLCPENGTTSGVKPSRLGFMIVGAQKSGTTALAHFLSQHPEICMPSPREVHLFDSSYYSSGWNPEQIDQCYVPAFNHSAATGIRGEATPIYMFLPEIARELKQYNPELKLIVLLRDPVERAISDYRRQVEKGNERLPLWLALLAEPLRVRRCRDARQPGSAVRVHTYRRRGLYSVQLRNLYRFFDREKVLIIGAGKLRQSHDAVLQRVFAFVGVSEDVRVPPEIVRPLRSVMGGSGDNEHRVVSRLLRLSYLVEFIRLRSVLRGARNGLFLASER